MKKLLPKVEKRERTKSDVADKTTSEESSSEEGASPFMSSEVRQALQAQEMEEQRKREREEANHFRTLTEELDESNIEEKPQTPTNNHHSPEIGNNTTETTSITSNEDSKSNDIQNTDNYISTPKENIHSTPKKVNVETPKTVDTPAVEPLDDVESRHSSNNDKNKPSPRAMPSISFDDGYGYTITHTFHEHTQFITKLQFMKDTKSLFCSASHDGTVVIYNLHKNIITLKMVAHKDSPITDFDWSTNNEYLLTASLDHTVKLWQPEEKKKIQTFYLGVRAQAVAFNPANNNQFVVGDSNGTLHVFNVSNSKSQKIHREKADSVTALAFSSNGYLFVGDSSGLLQVWKCTVPRGLFVLKRVAHYKRGITNILYSSNLNAILINIKDSKMNLLSVPDLKLKSVYFHPQSTYNMRGTLSPKSTVTATGAEDCSIRLSDVDNGSLLKNLQADEVITCVDFSPDEKHLISGTVSGKVYVWTVPDAPKDI